MRKVVRGKLHGIRVTEAEIEQIRPAVLTFNPDNSINERLGYAVSRDTQDRLTFEILKFQPQGSENP